MGSCLIYSNAVIAGLIVGKICEMPRHPAHGALNIIVKKRTIDCNDDSRDTINQGVEPNRSFVNQF